MPFVNDCHGDFAVRMRLEPGGGDPVHSLIWGDPLTLTGEVNGEFNRVEACARTDPELDGTFQASLPAAALEIRPRNQTYRRAVSLPVSTDLVYGLINTRTDGSRIVCGTLEEIGTEFDFKVLRAGVDVN